MAKNISSKKVALISGVLVFCFAITFYAVAWQEPSQDPPSGNVPSPLNVGPESQQKEGQLSLGTLCIGGECREDWPEGGSLTTYKLSVSAFSVGYGSYPRAYVGSKQTSFTCPSGEPLLVSCSSISHGGYPLCSCGISGSTATLQAGVAYTAYSSGQTATAVVSACNSSPPTIVWSGSVYCSPATCEMEFQCVDYDSPSTDYSEESCSSAGGFFSSSGSCNTVSDNAYCNSQCQSVGWDQGVSSNCSSLDYSAGCTTATYCGISLCRQMKCNPMYGGSCSAVPNQHVFDCRCSNN